MRGAATGLLALVALAGAARATDYYACNCMGGAEPGCRPGDDAGAGTSPGSAWRSYDRLLAAVAGSRCGDSFNFYRGGVFRGPGRSPDWAVAHQDCAARPRVVQSYDPGGVSRRPRIQGDGTLFSLNAPGARGARGVVIRGLDLVCTGACRGGGGAILGNVDEVLLDDLLVDGFNVCVQWGTNNGAVASVGLVIRNNSIAMGSSGGGRISAAIDARHDPRFGPFGRGLAIVSNAIQMLGDGPNDTCFRFFDDALVADLEEDYNVCGRPNTKARHASTRTALSLEEWRRAHPRQGVHSADADPDFAEPGAPRFDFSLGPRSPARDAGDPARSAATDIHDVARPVGRAPDGGAEESGAAR